MAPPPALSCAPGDRCGSGNSEGEEGGGGAIRFAASPTARVSSTASASFAITSGKLTVGSGTGFDEEAVKRDLEAMERVEKEDARKLRQWCEKRSQHAHSDLLLHDFQFTV